MTSVLTEPQASSRSPESAQSKSLPAGEAPSAAVTPGLGVALGAGGERNGNRKPPLLPEQLLYLQRTAGNLAVQRLLAGREGIQRRAANATTPIRTGAPTRANIGAASGGASPHISAHRGGKGMIQRVVTQIIPESIQKIKDVRIIGRPPKTYSASMGDHSTAFAAQLHLVRSALAGKSYEEAVANMDTLVKSLIDLPGMHKVREMGGTQYTKFYHAWDELIDIRKLLPAANKPVQDWGKETPAMSPLGLQRYVNAYLEVRELVPFSTVNIRAKSAALAGKGKGESGHANLLHQNETDGSPDKESVQKAIFGLFDSSAAAIVAAEVNDDLLQLMSPGMTTAMGVKDRIQMLIHQHLIAIHSSYPNALAKAGFDAKSGYEALLKEVLPKLLVRLGEEKAFAQRRIATLQGEIERINAELVHISRKATRDKKAEEAVPKQAQIVKLQSAIAEIDGLIKAHTPEPEKKEDKGGMDIAAIANTVVAKKVAKRGTTKGSGKHKRKSTPHGAKKRRSKDDSDDEEEIEVEVKSSKSLGKKQRSLVKSGLESEEDKSEEDKSEEDEDEDEETKKLPLATQIVMNGEGKITEMLSAGRSASPFSGTMGAHTTAWIVHLDRVRRAILGKDTDEAWTTVGTELFEEAKTMRENLKDAFPGSSFHVGLMDEAKRNFEEVGKKYESLDTQTKALFLQDYVNHLLTYINYIPGATLESADTGGKGEGRKRRTLLDYETGEADPGEEKVSQAISGLLDTKVVGSAEKKRALVKNHREIIEKTYPRSHELAYPNKSVGNSAKKRGRSDSLEAINKNLKGVKQVKAEPPPINSFLPDFSVFGSVAPSSIMLNSPNFGHSFYSPLVTGSPFGSYQPLPPSTGGFEFKFSPEWEKLNK